MTLSLALYRSLVPEGDLRTSVDLGGTGGAATIAVQAIVDHRPAISNTMALPGIVWNRARCGPTTTTISAVVTDESALTVTLVATTPAGEVRMPMRLADANRYTVAYDPTGHDDIRFVIHTVTAAAMSVWSAQSLLSVKVC